MINEKFLLLKARIGFYVAGERLIFRAASEIKIIMIHHSSLGATKTDIQKNLGRLIKKRDITVGGYKKARIYGKLNCSSGKRMNMDNRVFFKDEAEALSEGYRPCGHCLPEKYKAWKLAKMEGSVKTAAN